MPRHEQAAGTILSKCDSCGLASSPVSPAHSQSATEAYEFVSALVAANSNNSPGWEEFAAVYRSIAVRREIADGLIGATDAVDPRVYFGGGTGPTPSDHAHVRRPSLTAPGAKPPPLIGPLVLMVIFVTVGWAVYVEGFEEGEVSFFSELTALD